MGPRAPSARPCPPAVSYGPVSPRGSLAPRSRADLQFCCSSLQNYHLTVIHIKHMLWLRDTVQPNDLSQRAQPELFTFSVSPYLTSPPTHSHTSLSPLLPSPLSPLAGEAVEEEVRARVFLVLSPLPPARKVLWGHSCS